MVPKFLAWVSQLNLTYTPITITGPNQGWSYQPPNEVYVGNPAVNEVKLCENEDPFAYADFDAQTVFVAVTDTDMYLTPFNLTLINPHVLALGIMIAG
jgi:hypothetical protein